MKIVHTVESYLPAHHGMAEVVRQLSEGLVQLGHDVVILTSFHPERQIISEINGVPYTLEVTFFEDPERYQDCMEIFFQIKDLDVYLVVA